MFRETTLTVIFCFVTAFCFITATAGAEEAENLVVHIDSVTYEGNQTEETPLKLYMSGEKVEVVPEDRRSYFIFRGDKELVWLVDKQQETYIQIDEELLAEVKSQIEQMKEQLEGMPDQQRAMVGSMMKQEMQQAGLAVEDKKELKYNHTDETKEINNYPCRKTEIQRDSELVGDLWVTDWENIKHEDILKSAYRSMTNFVNSLRDIFEESMYQQYIEVSFIPPDVEEELEGMLISAVHYNNSDQPVAETTLIKIESKDLSGKTFTPPENYRLEKPELPE